jgi:hypothetical protein
VASYQPTLAIAQRDRAVRVLGYQGLIQPVSNVQPLLALTFSIDVKYVRHSFAPSETRKSVAPGLFQRFMDSGLKSQQCDRRDTARHNLRELGKSVLTGHKKEPRSTNARGCYRLLPQLVGSCVRAAIFVGGWGSSPGWPTNQMIGTTSINTTSRRPRLFTTLGNRKLRKRARLRDDYSAADR